MEPFNIVEISDRVCALVNPFGQFIGAIIMFFVLGFIPGYILAKVLNAFGISRVPEAIERAGLDVTKIHDRADDIKEVEQATGP